MHPCPPNGRVIFPHERPFLIITQSRARNSILENSVQLTTSSTYTMRACMRRGFARLSIHFDDFSSLYHHHARMTSRSHSMSLLLVILDIFCSSGFLAGRFIFSRAEAGNERRRVEGS